MVPVLPRLVFLGSGSWQLLIFFLVLLITVSCQSEPSHWSRNSQEQALLSVLLISEFKSRVPEGEPGGESLAPC